MQHGAELYSPIASARANITRTASARTRSHIAFTDRLTERLQFLEFYTEATRANSFFRLSFFLLNSL